MRSVVKARWALAVTFLLGCAVGAFGAAQFFRPRGPARERPTAHEEEVPRFVRELERYLRVRDDAQRVALRPLLLRTDSLNRAAVRDAQAEMQQGLRWLQARAATVLDAEQRQRLNRFIEERAGGGGDHPAPPGAGT